jgi:hypothetical protein
MIGNFYRSKPWIDLMSVIRMQRVNSDGFVICEHCGKPIVHKYDCIGHHIIELTEENYLDAKISLNPENVMLVHHRCHNIIHNKLGIGSKQVFLVYGSPLSGKTSWVNDNMSYGDLVIDMDSIWQCISGQDRYVKPNRLKQNVFAIRDELIDQVRVRRGNWLNAYIIGGYPLSSERERLIRSLGAREIFIDTTKEECLERLKSCDDSRDYNEYKTFIETWWDRYRPPSSI